MVCNPLEFEGIDYICQKLNIMVILDKPITREELVRLAENIYGDMMSCGCGSGTSCPRCRAPFRP